MSSDSSRLNISLLGPPAVVVDDKPIVVDTRKAIALLAYLAVSGVASTRDELVALFWPESEPDKGRSALRRTLSTLRSALDDRWIESDRFRIGLNRDGVVLDLEKVEVVVDHGHDPRIACPRCIEPLTESVALYRGLFMEGFTVAASPEFDQWLTLLQETHSREQRDLLERLANAHAGAGDYATAAGVARRRLELDPLDESAHRQLMLALAWAGDRSAAMAAYRSCVGVLDRELGVPPLEETVDLADAILSEDLPRMRGAVKTSSSRRPAVRPSALIGREVELQRLVGASGVCIVVSGEMGIGKTALLEAFEAADRRPVVSATCRESERTVPFGVISQLGRALLAEARPDLPEWAARELSRIVPEFGGSATSVALDPLAAERRLLDAVVMFLAEASRLHAIAVDDVQWVDQPSAVALATAGAGAGERNALFVLSGRWNDLPIDSPLRSTAAVTIELHPLLPEQSVALARASGVEVVDPQDLMRRTGGIPLFLVADLDGPGGEQVKAALMARVDRLDQLARQVMAAASIEDGPIDLDWLRLVSGRSEEELTDAIETLVGGGFLREQPGHIAFPHDIQRSGVYEQTSLARRRLLHRRAARVGADKESDVRGVAAAARHAALAGDDDLAAGLHLRAAELSQPAFDLAAEHYRSALGLGHKERSLIHRRLGEIAMLRGEYGSALQEFEKAAADGFDPEVEHLIGEIHRRLGRWDLAERHFRLSRDHHPSPSWLLADWALLVDRIGEGERASALAQEAVEAAKSDREAARALNVMGLLTANPVEARGRLEESLRRAGGDPVLRLAGIHSLSLVVQEAGDLVGAIDLTSQALELATTTGDRHRQAALHSRLADLYHLLGDEERSQAELTRSVRLFGEVGSGSGQIEPEVWMLTRW